MSYLWHHSNTIMNRSLIKKSALHTLDVEQKALLNLQNVIDEQFVEAVLLMSNAKGRLVVTGIGKSALIAQKIVATFNSTGSPSLFLHAADAIHGDLGMVTDDDVVLCLSKSGHTPEIKVLIPLLKNMGNPIIAVTRSKDSFLGKQASFVIETQVEEEGDPNNLAPMCSTTCQLAIGDAIASSLLALQGFSSAHFAKFHPGGTLGKQLYLRVKDLAEGHPIPKVADSASLRSCIIEMTSKRLGATAVVDASDKLVGIITDGDLRRMLTNEEDLSNITASDIMTSQPITVGPDTLAVEALATLRTKGLSQLIIAEQGSVLGFVHFHDILKEGLV